MVEIDCQHRRLDPALRSVHCRAEIDGAKRRRRQNRPQPWKREFDQRHQRLGGRIVASIRPKQKARLARREKECGMTGERLVDQTVAYRVLWSLER
jgi:hypothetical protein